MRPPLWRTVPEKSKGALGGIQGSIYIYMYIYIYGSVFREIV